jgi:ATP-dependent DNA helicase DinG
MIDNIEYQTGGEELNIIDKVDSIFSESGLLSNEKNFEYRQQHRDMAVAVAQALENGKHLIVEAGTGVGKSLAYLIPAILYAVKKMGKKAVISNAYN